jgi:hypothetical protein
VCTHVTGAEREILADLLAQTSGRTPPRRTLLEGALGPHERWDFSFATRLFAALR